jgi:hypothetical protein
VPSKDEQTTTQGLYDKKHGDTASGTTHHMRSKSPRVSYNIDQKTARKHPCISVKCPEKLRLRSQEKIRHYQDAETDSKES